MAFTPVSPHSSSSEYSETLTSEDSESIYSNSSEVDKSPTDSMTSSENLSTSNEDRFSTDTDNEWRGPIESIDENHNELNEYETVPQIEPPNEVTQSNDEQNLHNDTAFRSSSSSPLSVASAHSIRSYKPLSRWSAERVVEFLSRTPISGDVENVNVNRRLTKRSQSGNVCRKRIGQLLKLCKKDETAPSRIRQVVNELEICRQRNINPDQVNEYVNNADGSSDSTTERYSSDGIEETSIHDPTAYNFGSYSSKSDKNTRSSQLCDEDFLEHMVRETNRCALVLKTSSERFVRDWYDIKLHRLPLFPECNRNNIASLITPF